MSAPSMPKAKKKAKKKATKKIQAYAFIDTNIFLDFYRGSEASLSLLEKLEQVCDRVICTYQVEMEFLKNRQAEIGRIANRVDLSLNVALPAVLADTQLSASIKTSRRDLRTKQTQLNRNLLKLLRDPKNDRVYKVLEKVFRSESEHVLTRDMDIKNKIKRLARRRFQLGYPPRKAKDTSMGDAFNWEWIIHCASRLKGRFIIVSKDSDFGIAYKEQYFLNDQLKQEFRERVGQKSLLYTHELSVALSELEVQVTDEERASEAEEIVQASPTEIFHQIQQRVANIAALAEGFTITPLPLLTATTNTAFDELHKRFRDNEMKLAEYLGKTNRDGKK